MTGKRLTRIKLLVWIACLAPIMRLGYKALTGGLTANPIEFITLSTGTWTLVFVMATLGISPLRRFTGQNWLIKLRRLIGLFAFFYGSLHFLTYIWLDKFFDLHDMAHDVLKRPFITAGFFAFVLMIPLAVTSTAGSIRRMGGRRWQLLHRLIYLTGVAGVVHYWWKVKADTRQPAIYATVLAVLLGCRAISWGQERAIKRRKIIGVPRRNHTDQGSGVGGRGSGARGQGPEGTRRDRSNRDLRDSVRSLS